MALKPILPGNMVDVPATGGGGATIPATTNLIAGDGSGNGADSGRSVASVPTVTSTTNILIGDGNGNAADSNRAITSIPSVATTSNLLAGDNAGNAADSEISSTTVVTSAGAGAAANNLAMFTGSGPSSLGVADSGINVSALPQGPLSLASLYLVDSITPCPDGTVTPVTSITTVNGIITAIS